MKNQYPTFSMDAVRGADLTQRHKAGLCWPGSLHHQNLGFLCRSLRGSPQDCKRLAYIALVWSGLEDASIIWHPTLKTDAEALEHIQRKSTRWVTSMYETRASVSKLLKDLQWETLETRHRQQCSFTRSWKNKWWCQPSIDITYSTRASWGCRTSRSSIDPVLK